MTDPLYQMQVHKVTLRYPFVIQIDFKAAYSVTMNFFRKKYSLFKSFVKVE